MLGMEGVRSRMAEIQARIDGLAPRPEPFDADSGRLTTDPSSFPGLLDKFSGNLSGAIGQGTSGLGSGDLGTGGLGGNVPANPLGMGLVPTVGEAQLRKMASAAAVRNGVDPVIFECLVEQESGFDPTARSPVGALGLTQLMPETARSLGVTNPLDPQQNLDGGARYLSQMMQRFGNDREKALAAYNAGPGAVERSGGVPNIRETRNYVERIMAKAYGR